MSHSEIGWELFTDNVIKFLNDREEPIIFVFWGSYARKKKKFITNSIHYVIESSHPSPLSVNISFLGSKQFSKINSILTKNNNNPIDWHITY